MKLNEMKPPKGSTHSKKRVGRGPGSGHGKNSGRGENGQKSRSGFTHKYGFEGGQMPLIRRVPKRGFKNVNRIEYQIVNVNMLNIYEDGALITKETLKEKNLISKTSQPVKILGQGDLERKLTVKVDKVSATAKAKIEANSGLVEVSVG
ncbi:50S ribosomal protein L15 [candidate division WOR-3 bacterium]|nr:50S ribosomal protein L15 [candidate division WOR-3 bacterium]